MKIMKITSSRFLLLLNLFFITHQISAKNFDLVEKIKKHKFKIACCIITGTGLYCLLRYLNNQTFQAHLNDFESTVTKETQDVQKAKRTIQSLINCSKSWFCSSSNRKKFEEIARHNKYSFYLPADYKW